MAGKVKTIKISVLAGHTDGFGEQGRTAHSFYVTLKAVSLHLAGGYENSKYYKLLNGTWKFYYSDSHRSLPRCCSGCS